MYSIHEPFHRWARRASVLLPGLLFGLGLLSLGGGCTLPQRHPEPVMADPPADEATTMRNWERTTSVIASGAVVAKPTYNPDYPDRVRALRHDWAYAAVAPAVLVSDGILLPFRLVAIPPWRHITYRGVETPPSMTVAPPLPPG